MSKEVKKITLGLVLSWIFGILFLIMGFVIIFSSTIYGILIILCSLIILPYFNKFILERFHFNLVGIKIFFVFLTIIFMVLGIVNSQSSTTNTKEDLEPNYVEISVDELYSIFGDYSELSEIQKKDKYEKEFEGKLIKSSIEADKIDKASLSSKYVVLDMLTQLSCKAKAFFPSEEKDKLLSANIGDTIVFHGKLIVYKFGFAECLTFEEAKVLEIKNEK